MLWEKKKMVENIKDNDNNQTTFLDAEIAALEARLPDLEAERNRLLAGQVAIPGLGGGAAAIHIDVSQYIKIQDKHQRNQELQALLTDSPVFQGLVDGYRSKQELAKEMVIAGVLPQESLALDAKAKARISSHKLGEQTGQGLARILPKVARWAKSPWLLLVGLLLLILWGGAWFLHLATSGGGSSATTTPTPNNKGVITSTASPNVTKNGIQTTQAAPQSQSQLNNKVAYYNYYYNTDIMKMPMADETVSSVITTTITTTGSSITPTPTVINDNDKTASLTATPSLSPSTAAITTPTPIPATPAPTSNTPAPVVTGQQPAADSYNRVGQPPTDLGGLNGPHGAFLAPSRLSVPALSVDVGVQKALVQEQIITTTTATISTTTMPASTPTTPTQTQPQVQQVGVAVVWPRPGEVLHIGAYPGEIGNCIILGTQQNLAPLRRLEQNDIIKLYDRDKNVYSYRVLAFSATGQPERSVNPAWQGDNWIMQPDTQGQALLTIVISMPQPLPPFDPNANAGAATTNSTGVDGQGQTAYKDDFTSPLKLAYRAVLVAYTPVQVSPGATPVPVTGQVWQTQPMPQLQVETTPPTPTPASVPTPTPTVQSPYPSISDPKEQNFLLELIRRAAAAARSGTTLLPTPSIPTTPTPGR